MRLTSDPATRRPHMVAIAGGLALSLQLVHAPAVMAGDDGPEATVSGFLAALEAGDLEAMSTFYCAEHAEAMGGFDLSSSGSMPPGVDPGTLLDAFAFDVELASTEVVSQTATEAVVRIEGSTSVGIDPEAVRPFIEAVLSAARPDVTPDMVEAFTGSMLARFEARSVDISGETRLVPGESGAWLICDDHGG